MNGAAAVWASTRTTPSSRKITSNGNIHHFRLVVKKSQKSAKKPGFEASWSRSSLFSVTDSGSAIIDSVRGAGGDSYAGKSVGQAVQPDVREHLPCRGNQDWLWYWRR